MASTYWNSDTEEFLPIPTAHYYVLADDPFMSGWGNAQGKTNTVVVPCDTKEQVEGCMSYIRSRGDMKRLRYVIHKPAARDTVVYSLYPDWANRSGGWRFGGK